MNSFRQKTRNRKLLLRIVRQDTPSFFLTWIKESLAYLRGKFPKKKNNPMKCITTYVIQHKPWNFCFLGKSPIIALGVHSEPSVFWGVSLIWNKLTPNSFSHSQTLVHISIKTNNVHTSYSEEQTDHWYYRPAVQKRMGHLTPDRKQANPKTDEFSFQMKRKVLLVYQYNHRYRTFTIM